MTKNYAPHTSQPLVSIGIPVFNGARYLREALDSLLAQTYGNFELVISDNASTDDTQKICAEYAAKDPRIRYIRQNENIGGLENFDFLKNTARGEYFMWGAHDDRWDKRFIEKCLTKFAENPGAVMAFSNFIVFDDSGRTIRFSPKEFFPCSKNPYERLKSYLLLRSKYGKTVLIYGLWKRSILSDIVSPNDICTDMSYVFKNLFLGYFVLVDEVLHFRRALVQHIPPAMKNWPREKLESVDGWHEIRNAINRNRGWRAIAAGIKERISAISAPYFFIHSRYIVRSRLTPAEKVRLLFWNTYAYLQSIWYGHM